jgi:predicted nucleic acid-binding protein
MSARYTRIVAIDSMTLVWGIRKRGSKENLEHAAILFAELERDDATIIVPAVVVAEYLIPVPSEDRDNTVTALQRFQIEPFDVRDAVLAAKLWSDGKTRRQMASAGARICLRADTLIVATAKNRGAREFYTDDNDCFDMATRAGMAAKKLPTMDGRLFPDA